MVPPLDTRVWSKPEDGITAAIWYRNSSFWQWQRTFQMKAAVPLFVTVSYHFDDTFQHSSYLKMVLHQCRWLFYWGVALWAKMSAKSTCWTEYKSRFEPVNFRMPNLWTLLYYLRHCHYTDVMMSAMSSQITGVYIVRRQAIFWTQCWPDSLTHKCGTKGRWVDYDCFCVGSGCYISIQQQCVWLLEIISEETEYKMPLSY